MSKLGVTDLIFVDSGIKVNGEYYREVLLSQELLPAIREMSGDFICLSTRQCTRTQSTRHSSASST